MKDNPNRREKDELTELLSQYNNLRQGNEFKFLEEESFEKIIDYFDDNEQLPQAIEAADHGIELYPYSSLLMIKKADLLIATRKFSEALGVLEQVSVLDQTDINLYILKAEVFLGLGFNDKAKALLDDSAALFEGKEKTEFLFEMSDVFDDYEQFNEVFHCLEMILLKDPSNQEALYKICFWTDYSGKFEESIELHRKLIDKEPYNHLAWYNLGTAFQGLKLYERAIDAYLYAIAIDDKFDYAYRNLGDAYIRIKNYKEAIDTLEKVLELSIPEDVIYEALGHCYEKLKNPAQARAHYRKAVHLKPEESHLFYRIAATYMQEGNWKNAIQQLESAIAIQPFNADYQFALAQSYDMSGKVKDAVTFYLLFISTRPKSIKGWKAMVTCLYDHGYMDQAFLETESAFISTKGKMIFIYYKAAILLQTGKSKEGLLLLEQAIKASPKQLKEFIALDASLLQRNSVVKVINNNWQKTDRPKRKR